MMRRAMLLMVCAVSMFAHAQLSKSKLTLPCESSFQMLSPSGIHAAIRCKDDSWDIIDLANGKSVHRISGKPPLSAYSFSDDGKWFACGSWDGSVQLLPLASGATPVTWRPDAFGPDVILVLPSGQVLVAPHEKQGQIWQITPERKLIATLPTDFSGLTFAAASPDGKLLAIGGADTAIRIYDTASWKMNHEYRDLTLEPFAGAFTAGGKYLLVGGADNRITIIDPQNGKGMRTLPASPDVVAEIHPLADDNNVIALQWDADGKNPPYLALWDLTSGVAKKIDSPQPITGGGVVKGVAWFTSASAKTMEIWTREPAVAGK